MKDNRSRAEITANRIDVGGVVLMLAFVAVSAATVLAKGACSGSFSPSPGLVVLGSPSSCKSESGFQDQSVELR
ncbi:MAG TPA: hypothetical protein VIX19_15790 [Terriglobales bacterium]